MCRRIDHSIAVEHVKVLEGKTSLVDGEEQTIAIIVNQTMSSSKDDDLALLTN